VHVEAFDFTARAVSTHGPFTSVVEFGARDVNGSVRPLFVGARYVGVDIAPGYGVDVVADAVTWRTPDRYQAVVCCEVAEHTPDWPGIVESAFAALEPGGVLILTAAGPGREPHSAVDGGPIRPGEYYVNIEADDLDVVFDKVGFTSWQVDILGPDIRAIAHKGGSDG
jgi:hypothetical protein